MTIASGKPGSKGRVWHAATWSTIRWQPGAGKDRAVLEDWTRIFEPNWQQLCMRGGLRGLELRLLVFCATILGKDNILQLSQKVIAERLEVTPGAISRAMRALVRGGLIFQDGHTYRLNSRLSAKGEMAGIIRLRHEESKRLTACERAWMAEEQAAYGLPPEEASHA